MSEFTIDYKIENVENPEDVKDSFQIDGAIRVKYDNVVLTKANVGGDDGYIGDYIFYEVYGFIEAVKWLLLGEGYINEIMEEAMAFYTKFDNGDIYFSVVATGIDEDNVESVKYGKMFADSYPCGEQGCPISAEIFYREVIRLGNEFLNDVLTRYKKLEYNPDIIRYKNLLREVTVKVDQYNIDRTKSSAK